MPINALWPLVVFAVKYIWDRLRLFRAKVEELTDSKEVPEVTSSAEWKKRISSGSEERRVGKECRSRWSP